MLDDFVEICSNKKPTAKTISCCFHYLMRLQSGKWTRKQIIVGGGGKGIFISLQKSEKTISEIGGYKHRKCLGMFFVFLYHYSEPSSLHTAP